MKTIEAAKESSRRVRKEARKNRRFSRVLRNKYSDEGW